MIQETSQILSVFMNICIYINTVYTYVLTHKKHTYHTIHTQIYVLIFVCGRYIHMHAGAHRNRGIRPPIPGVTGKLRATQSGY